MLFVFVAAAFVQISLWIVLWIGLRRAARATVGGPTGKSSSPISVVVATRNAGTELETLLYTLGQQRHNRFEIVIVDDGSEDHQTGPTEPVDTGDRRIRLVTNPRATRGKKRAVALGIEVAVNDIIARTDVDCRPGPEWLGAHVKAQDDRPHVVVGYGSYAPRPSLLNAVVRFETLVTGMMTASAIGLGRPYMAVGRNLSCTKEIVSAVGSTVGGVDLLSGDDDLFVQAAVKEGFTVSYLFDPDSFVESDAPESLGSWLRQKRRHFSAGRAYDPIAKAALAVFHGSSLACWIAPLVIGWPGVAVLCAKLGAQSLVTTSGAKLFRERGLIAGLPLFDLAWLVLVALVGPVGMLFPPSKW